MLKEELTISIFNISTFSMVLCLFLLHLMEIFPKTIFGIKQLLSTAYLWLSTLKQRLTQNFQWLTTTQPIVTPKIDFEKRELP